MGWGHVGLIDEGDKEGRQFNDCFTPDGDDSDIKITPQHNTINVKVGDKLGDINALLDTGCFYNLINVHAFCRNTDKYSEKLVKTDSLPQLVTADNTPLNVLASSDLTIALNDHQFTIKVYIVDSLYCDLILGSNTLGHLGTTIDLGNNIVTFKPSYDLTLLGTIMIPAHSEMIVRGSLDGELPDGYTGLINGGTLEHEKYAFIEDTVCRTFKCTVPVKITNTCALPIQLWHGTNIGSFYLQAEDSIHDVEVDGDYKGPQLTNVCAGIRRKKLAMRSGEKVTQSDMSPEEETKLESLLGELGPGFVGPDGVLGYTDIIEHNIRSRPHTNPVRQRPYRLPPKEREAFEVLLGDLLKQGIVQESVSPWSSPIVLVDRGPGKPKRLCIDFRMVNQSTIPDSYPMTPIQECIEELHGLTWVSSLDLASGYFQVKLAQESREKTAFVCHMGLYEFNRMPQGLRNAGATFQRLMQIVLRGIKGIIIYLDDVCIVTRHGDFDQHLKDIRVVMERLIQTGLKCQRSKCSFGCHTLTYLGHVISRCGLSPSPDLVSAVATHPTPADSTEVKQFVGLVSFYRRFIKGFAKIARPLHNLMRDGVPFVWDEDCVNAFTTLRDKLLSAEILKYPDWDSEFVLTTDGCVTGVGSVLSQLCDVTNTQRPICYHSRSLNKHEANYGISELEMLAVVDSIEKFRHYLSHNTFLLITDHKALQWLMTMKKPSGKLYRWIMAIQGLNFKIEHRPGTSIQHADSLSRIKHSANAATDTSDQNHDPLRELDKAFSLPLIQSAQPAYNMVAAVRAQRSKQVADTVERTHNDAGAHLPPGLTIDSIKAEQQTDTTMGQYITYITTSELPEDDREASYIVRHSDNFMVIDEVLYFLPPEKPRKEKLFTEKLRLVIPEKHRMAILGITHVGPWGGHMGPGPTYNKTREHFYWAGMQAMIVRYVKACVTCNQKKLGGPPVRAELGRLPAWEPFERVAIDLAGKFVKSPNGNHYMLVVVDYFTSWVEAYPLANKRASTVAWVLYDQFFTRFGAPIEIRSDLGSEFIAQVHTEMCTLLTVSRTTASPYSPWSNGKVERKIRSIIDVLINYVDKNQKNWEAMLNSALMALRITPSTVSGHSPYMLLMARMPRLPINIALSTPDRAPLDVQQHLEKTIEALKTIHTEARANIKRYQSRMRAQYNSKARPRKFEVGNIVYLRKPKLTAKGLAKKFVPRFHGPYYVTRTTSPFTCRLARISDNKPLKYSHHVNHLKRADYRVGDRCFTTWNPLGLAPEGHTAGAVVDDSEPSDDQVDILNADENDNTEADNGPCDVQSGQEASNEPPQDPVPGPSGATQSDSTVDHGSTKIVYKHMLHNGVHLSVERGDIVSLEADCIVNAANPELQHNGGVAKTICQAAGPQFQIDSNDLRSQHGTLSVTEVLGQAAMGTLKCKTVLHVVGPTFTGNREQCHKDLQSSFQNVLQYAEGADNISTLAVPMVGSGIFGCPINIVAKSLGQCLVDYARKTSQPTLKTITLIDKDQSKLNAFVVCMQQLCTNQHNTADHPSMTNDQDSSNSDSDSEYETEQVFEIDKVICGKYTKDGQILYKIRWKNYGAKFDTYEPYANLNEEAKEYIQSQKFRIYGKKPTADTHNKAH